MGEKLFTSFCWGLTTATILIMLALEFIPRYITLEKSPDSEWVISKYDYPDTVITSVKVLEHEGKIDTIYPTTIYKRIEL